MPIIKSAKKRVRVAEKAAIRNAKTKRTLKTALKAFHKSLETKKGTAETQAEAVSNIDKAAKKGIIHPNKAARQKAALARAAKAAGAPAPAKSAAKKAAPKTSVKPDAKKATAKPAAAKKAAPAKKPAAKKAPAKKPAAKK